MILRHKNKVWVQDEDVVLEVKWSKSWVEVEGLRN